MLASSKEQSSRFLRVHRLCIVFVLLLMAPTQNLASVQTIRHELKKALSKGLLSFATGTQKDVMLSVHELSGLRSYLWRRYKKEVQHNPTRRLEHATNKLTFDKKTMHYFVKKIGRPPKSGYPLYIALHGGGNASSSLNDAQWRHMQRYYRTSVKAGVYVAPRGISNTSDLHARPASIPLYDRLIENMLAFEHIDPNRVYVLGFSAGGDGVYQIVPELADRFAAANMSAGHPGGAEATNFLHVPLLLQVGEWDKAYKRHLVTVDFYKTLRKLSQQFPGMYRHQLFLHARRYHNFLDNDPKRRSQVVIQDPLSWRRSPQQQKTLTRNTNAVDWVSRYKRNPYPKELRWDIRLQQDRSGKIHGQRALWLYKHKGSAFYWLDTDGYDSRLTGEEIHVRLDKKRNRIIVKKAHSYIRILLRDELLDLSKQIHIHVGGQVLHIRVNRSLRELVKSLLQRGDPSYFFEASVILFRDKGRWQAIPS